MPRYDTLPFESVVSFADAAAVLFALVIGHALADFPLQGDFLSRGKNRHLPPPKLADGDSQPSYLWAFLMSAHAMIHAGFVWVITGSILFAALEFILHWLIDVLKCEGKTGFAMDQFLHVATKVLFIVMWWAGYS
ncbi:MAG: DUF3307 domain-containing protein [Verrucomicrobiota bacterium]